MKTINYEPIASDNEGNLYFHSKAVYDLVDNIEKENVRLTSIINEARSYLKAVGSLPKQIDSFVLLEILDKVGDKIV